MFHQAQNIIQEIETVKKNQMGIVALKSMKIEMKNLLE